MKSNRGPRQAYMGFVMKKIVSRDRECPVSEIFLHPKKALSESPKNAQTSIYAQKIDPHFAI
jgi:hypothetical protein